MRMHPLFRGCKLAGLSLMRDRTPKQLSETLKAVITFSNKFCFFHTFITFAGYTVSVKEFGIYIPTFLLLLNTHTFREIPPSLTGGFPFLSLHFLRRDPHGSKADATTPAHDASGIKKLRGRVVEFASGIRVYDSQVPACGNQSR